MLIGNNKYFMPLTLAPGAVGAYSLRRLRGDYTGPVINVRRSSDNVTADIGLLGRGLDEASLLSFVGANNGFIATWYDQSGNGRHVVQATASAQPQIVSAGVVETQSGKPTLLFDGARYLRLNYGVTHTVPNTVFGMFSNTSVAATTGNHLFNSFSANSHTVYITLTGFYGIYRGSSIVSSVDRGTTPKIVTALFNATTMLFLNSQLAASGNAGTSSFTPLSLGCSFVGSAAAQWVGLISELIFYNADQAANRASFENNINAFYSVY